MWIRTRFFLNMLNYFYKIDIPKNFTNKINQLKSLELEESQHVYNKYLNMKTDISKIVHCVENMRDIRTQLIFKLMLYMGWRSQNIKYLTLDKNVKYEKGQYIYHFEPEEQKAPLIINGLKKHIIGTFPDHIAKLLDLYIPTISGIKLFFKRDLYVPYSDSWLNSYVKKTCESMGLPRLSPHDFRSIVFDNYIHATNDIFSAETWLWHKVKSSGSFYNYIKPDYDNAVKKIGDYLNSLLLN